MINHMQTLHLRNREDNTPQKASTGASSLIVPSENAAAKGSDRCQVLTSTCFAKKPPWKKYSAKTPAGSLVGESGPRSSHALVSQDLAHLTSELAGVDRFLQADAFSLRPRSPHEQAQGGPTQTSCNTMAWFFLVRRFYTFCDTKGSEKEILREDFRRMENQPVQTTTLNDRAASASHVLSQMSSEASIIVVTHSGNRRNRFSPARRHTQCPHQVEQEIPVVCL